MQARLPDVNTSITKYRTDVLHSLRAKRYTECTEQLYLLNGIMPEEYRIDISNERFEKITENKTIATCYKCSAETNILEMKKRTYFFESDMQLLLGKSSREEILCPECNTWLVIAKVNFALHQTPPHQIIKIVPEPPTRMSAKMSPNTFHIHYEKWALRLLREIEAGASLWRQDYGSDEDLAD